MAGSVSHFGIPRLQPWGGCQEFGKPLSYINGKHIKAACKLYWNRKIRREDAYNDTYIKIGKRHFSGEDFGGI